MKVVLVTGLSGSGKSVAIRALEDADFYCIDNLPPSFIPQVLKRLEVDGIVRVAVAADARTGRDIVDVPHMVADLRNHGTDVRVLFLNADDETLVTRYSETRRRHPMSARLGEQATVQECVAAEREALEPLRALASCIDTTGLLPNALRRWVLETVESKSARITLVFETFGFKKGLPTDADLVFDVRCLTNPYYDKSLRALTGQDTAVQEFIQADERSSALIADIEQYLRKWLPAYLNEQRSYITVAIGCTGGQHRSVYVAEMLSKAFTTHPLTEVESVLLRHRSISQ